MSTFTMDAVKGGKIAGPKGVAVLVLVILFVVWRMTSGVANPDRILGFLQSELEDEYRQEVYRDFGLLGGAEPPSPTEGFPTELLEDMTVTFDNVRMSASIFSWSAMQEVVVRFDYVLEAGGEVRESGQGVYKRVAPGTSRRVWDSDPVSFWVNYF